MASQLQWDTVFSQYWWVIELDPSHPDNNGKALKFDGYSKAVGHAENQDKIQLLCRKIVMLITRGYLDKANRITFHMRFKSYIDKNHDPAILELTKNDFNITQEFKLDKSGLVLFLKKVFEDLKQGKSIEYLLPKPTKPNYKRVLDKKLAPGQYDFRTFADVQVKCEQLLSEGFNRGDVTHFYRKSIEILERKGITI